MSHYPRTLRIDDGQDEFILEVALELFAAVYKQHARAFHEIGADDRLVQGFSDLEARSGKLIERLHEL